MLVMNPPKIILKKLEDMLSAFLWIVMREVVLAIWRSKYWSSYITRCVDAFLVTTWNSGSIYRTPYGMNFYLTILRCYGNFLKKLARLSITMNLYEPIFCKLMIKACVGVILKQIFSQIKVVIPVFCHRGRYNF